MADGIKEAVEHVEEEVSDVARIEDVLSGGRNVTADFEDKCKSSAPDGVDKDEEDAPTGDTAGTTWESRPIEECTEHEGSEDFRQPIAEIVESAGADVEVVGVDVVELVCVDPIGGPEHGEEEDNVVVCLQSFEETLQFGPIRC